MNFHQLTNKCKNYVHKFVKDHHPILFKMSLEILLHQVAAFKCHLDQGIVQFMVDY